MDKGMMDLQLDDDLIQRDVSEIKARAAVLEEETETQKALESLSEAAAKIVPSDLAAFLAKQNAVPEAAFWSFYFYLESAFTQVSSQWLNVFKEFPWSHYFSSSHIPKFVYETSDAWINQLQTDTHCTFVMWALDRLLTSWAAHAQDTSTCSSKSSEVAAFVALAIMLRSKPLALIYLLPMLRDSPRYHGEDKLPVILWTMAQAFFKGDLSVGLYSWAHNLLPLADNSKGYSPQSVDLILRFAVFILLEPNARTILLDEAAVRKEDQLIIPPSSFEILVRLTFPASSARVEATERFGTVYPLLKEVAFAPGSNTVKQIFTLSFNLFGDGLVTGNPFLAKEATAVAFSCVTENVDCFKQWDILYKKNIEASVALLKKLVDEWKDHSLKLLGLLSSPSDTLTVNDAIHNFRIKNENAITEGVTNCFLYKEADKACKLISRRLSRDYLIQRAVTEILPPWFAAVLREDEEAVEIPDEEEVKAAVREEKTETQKALASLLGEDEEAVEIPDEEEVKAAVPEEKTETQKALASLSEAVAKLRQSLMDFRIKSNPKEEEEVVLESSCPEAAAGIGPSHLPILPDEAATTAEETEKAITSLSEAVAKIVPSDLAAFLAVTLDEHWPIPTKQMLIFVEYYDGKLSQESFRWVKMFQETPLSTLIHVPFSQIPTSVYELSVNFINKVPCEASLCGFVMWASDLILTEWPGVVKKKQNNDDLSKVAIFVVLAMLLRCKPDALTTVLPKMRDRPTYQGEGKLPFIIWMMAQASQGALSAGLYSWSRNLLPLVGSNKCYSPQAMDLILQFVEMILSNPEARTILLNEAVWEGERLIPPSSFKILVQHTFPASSARVEATKRFEAIYPLLKEVALAPENATGSNKMKQIFTFSLRLAGEGAGNPVQAKEAIAIAICCVTKNVDCFNHWKILYMENIKASVALLKKLVDDWKDLSLKLSSSPSDALAVKHTIYSFRMDNEKAIAEGDFNCFFYKEADKSCKLISRRLSRGNGGLQITAMVIAAAAAAVGGVVGAALALSFPVAK